MIAPCLLEVHHACRVSHLLKTATCRMLQKPLRDDACAVSLEHIALPASQLIWGRAQRTRSVVSPGPCLSYPEGPGQPLCPC